MGALSTISSTDRALRLRTWNAETLLEISSLDSIVTPSNWQKSQFPAFLRDSIQVLHEGVDFEYLSSLRTNSSLGTPPFFPQNPDSQILTYVSRCFEEYRGFPQAAQTISKLLYLRPNLHVYMVGRDCTAYGNARSDGKSWSVWAQENLDFPSDRIHWLGSISETDYHQVLSVSNVHLYLTVPFVLSWSLLEAMSVGIPIVASNTPPVAEVIEHEKSGLLVDFFDVDGQVEAVNRILNNLSFAQSLSNFSKKEAAKYSCQLSLDSWASVLCL